MTTEYLKILPCNTVWHEPSGLPLIENCASKKHARAVVALAKKSKYDWSLVQPLGDVPKWGFRDAIYEAAGRHNAYAAIAKLTEKLTTNKG